jgi:aldehyde:ferredoxin oxidoreductase
MANKFAGTPDRVIGPAFQALYGVDINRDDMLHATQRTYLRGLLLERKQGISLAEYVLPARAYQRNPHVQLPHFITPAFWEALRTRVFQEFDKQVESYGLQVSA